MPRDTNRPTRGIRRCRGERRVGIDPRADQLRRSETKEEEHRDAHPAEHRPRDDLRERPRQEAGEHHPHRREKRERDERVPAGALDTGSELGGSDEPRIQIVMDEPDDGAHHGDEDHEGDGDRCTAPLYVTSRSPRRLTHAA